MGLMLCFSSDPERKDSSPNAVCSLAGKQEVPLKTSMALAPKFFGTLEYDVSHLIVNNECWFRASHIGENLEYANPVKACRDCVKEKYRTRRCELVDPADLDQYERNTMYINEAGLWCWLATSKQPKRR